jgi:hypothetical protein
MGRGEQVWAGAAGHYKTRSVFDGCGNGCGQVRAPCRGGRTIGLVELLFSHTHDDGSAVRLWVPPAVEVLCFLRRRHELFGDDEPGGENGGDFDSDDFDDDFDDGIDMTLRALLEDFGDGDRVFDYMRDAEAEIDELLSDDDVDEELVWELASMFSVHRFAATWWRSGDNHGNDCRCGPVTLLEVLQDFVVGDGRQVALDAHLTVLHGAWDHFWSGDSLIRSGSSTIGGACAYCIGEGRTHLSDVLDEARSLAEDLGEALAAFKTNIAIGVGRYPDPSGDTDADI